MARWERRAVLPVGPFRPASPPQRAKLQRAKLPPPLTRTARDSGAPASSPGGGLRPASRESATPAPMTLCHANVRPAALPLSPGGRDRSLRPRRTVCARRAHPGTHPPPPIRPKPLQIPSTTPPPTPDHPEWDIFEAHDRRSAAPGIPSVNTSATRMTGLSRRRDTSSGRPSGRGGRRAGIRHRPGGRRWRARRNTVRIDRNGRVTLPCRAGSGDRAVTPPRAVRQAALVSPLFPAPYGILFALLAETAGDTGPRPPTVAAAEARAPRSPGRRRPAATAHPNPLIVGRVPPRGGSRPSPRPQTPIRTRARDAALRVFLGPLRADQRAGAPRAAGNSSRAVSGRSGVAERNPYPLPPVATRPRGRAVNYLPSGGSLSFSSLSTAALSVPRRSFTAELPAAAVSPRGSSSRGSLPRR